MTRTGRESFFSQQEQWAARLVFELSASRKRASGSALWYDDLKGARPQASIGNNGLFARRGRLNEADVAAPSLYDTRHRQVLGNSSMY